MGEQNNNSGDTNAKFTVDGDTKKAQQSIDELGSKVDELILKFNNLGEQIEVDLEKVGRLSKANTGVKFNVSTSEGNLFVGKGTSKKSEASIDKIASAIARQKNSDSANNTRRSNTRQYEAETERAALAERKLEEERRRETAAADAEYKSSRSRYYNAKSQNLYGYNQYSSSFSGGVAAALFNQGERYSYRNGFVGMAARLGSKWGNNSSSWFGKKFGSDENIYTQMYKSTGDKSYYDAATKLKNNNINSLFGGLLKAGTKSGAGINAGGLILGATAVALAAVAINLKKFGDACLDAYGSMEKLSTGLEVVYGSRVQSNQALNNIQQYAVKSPYGVSQTTDLAVLLKQSGVYSTDLLKTLEMIGDVSSGNEEKMKRIANNYAQIQAIGHASMLDMRQFAYAGIPIYKEVADYMNVSQSKLREMIKDGKVTSDVIEQVFKNMTGEGGTFHGAVDKGSRTYSARKQNLEDIKNIEKSNIGEWMYNLGDDNGKGGFGRGFMSMLESWHKSFSDYFKNKNISREGNISNYAQKEIISLSNELSRVISSGDKDLADSIRKELESYKKTVRNEDEIRAGLANKGYQYLGKKGFTYGEKTYTEEQRQAAYDKYQNYLVEKNVKFDPTSNSYVGGEGYDNKVAERLYDIYEKMVSQEKYDEAWNKLPGNIRRAIIESKVQEWQTSNIESYQKYQGAPNSISSLTDKYNQLYSQTKKGKAEQAEKDKSDLVKYRSDYSKYSKMVNNDGSLKFGQYSKEDLISAIKSGIIEADSQISLKPEDLKVNSYDNFNTVSEKLDTWKSIHKQASLLQQSISDGTFNKAYPNMYGNGSFSNPYGNLIKRLISVTNVTNSSQINDNVEQLIQIVKELIPIGEKTGTSGILGNIFIKGSKAGESKFTVDDLIGSGGGRSVPELWKRIFGAATGIDAYHMGNTSGYNAMLSYNNFQNRNIVGGAIKGLSASGLNSSQIASLLQFTGGTTNGDNVVITQKNGKALSNKNLVTVNGTQTKQIDWEQSMKSVVIDYALKGKGSTNTLANELNSLDDTMKSQLSVYTNLINTMQVTQEDWANIDTKSLSDSENKALENAFAGGTNGAYATGNNGEVFDVKYDAESRQWITTEGNKIVNAANGLTLKSDSITEALDMMQLKTQNLAVQISVANSLAQTSNELRKSSQENNIKSFMSSGYLQSNLGLTSEYSYNNKSNVYKKEAYDKVTSLLTERLVSLANETSGLQNNEEELDKWNNKRYSKDASGKYIEDAKGTFARDAIGNYVDANSEYEKLNTEKIKLLIQFVEAIDSFNGEGEKAILNQIINVNSVKDEADNYSRSLENNAYASSIGDYVSNYQQYNGNGGLFRALNNGMYVQNGNGLLQQSFMNKIGLPNGNFDRWSSGLFAQNYGNDEDYTSKLDSYLADKGYKGNIGEQAGYAKEAQIAFNSGDIDKGNEALSKIDNNLKSIIGDFHESGVAASDMADKLDSLGTSLSDVFKDTATSGISSTFETLGKSIISSSDASSDLADNFRQIGQSLYSQMGQMLVSAGLQMIIANPKQWYIGAALIAAGGMSSLLSGLMSDSSDDDNEYEKLKKLKEDLSDLLKQAKDDAVYYEQNLNHQTALSINSSVSGTKVNDAVITPSGNVISTHPDDYLIATKTPNSLMGSGGSSPNVNFTIQNNGQSVQLESQTTSQSGNDIDIVAVIKNVTGQYIASHESDDAFSARQYIQNGNRYAR